MLHVLLESNLFGNMYPSSRRYVLIDVGMCALIGLLFETFLYSVMTSSHVSGRTSW